MKKAKTQNIIRNILIIVIVAAIVLGTVLPVFAATPVDENQYPHDSLESAAEEAGDKVLARVKNSSSTSTDFYFSVGYKADTYDSPSICTAFRDVIEERTAKPFEGDAMHAALNSLSVITSKKQANGRYYIKVMVYGKYNLTAEQETQYHSQVQAIAQEAAGNDYEKALYLYKYVVNTVTYGSDKIDERNTYNTGYGALNYTATCNGISQLVYDLMNTAGVECRIVRNSEHAFNIVKIGGKWYLVDATFGNSVKDKNGTRYCLKGSNKYKEWASRYVDTMGGDIIVEAEDYVYDAAALQKPTAGWKKNGTGWWYIREDGTYPVSEWMKIEGVWYHFDNRGYMETGWFKDTDGKQYFLKPNGAMTANEWYDGYWFGKSGAWTYSYKGSWKKNSTGWWFGDTSGWYAKNESIKINGTIYTFDARGYLVDESTTRG